MFKSEGHRHRWGNTTNDTHTASIENASCLASSSLRSGREEAYVEMSQPSEVLEEQPFEILEVQTRDYRRFSTRGTQWKVRLNPPPEKHLPDPVTHFVDSVHNLIDHVLEDVAMPIWWGSLFTKR